MGFFLPLQDLVTALFFPYNESSLVETTSVSETMKQGVVM